MEWPNETQELYQQVTALTPDAFRPAVAPALQRAAEKTARLRNAASVSKEDLLSALFEITPEAFQPTVIADLKTIGIDATRFLALSEIRKTYARTWDEIGAAFQPGVYHFTMYLTDRCQQRCPHCATQEVGGGRHRDELSTEQWIEIVENVEQALRKDGRRGCYVWFGGEPTLRKDLPELIRYCGERGYHQAISTNGMLFDEELSELCAKAKMSHVFISYDSTLPERAAKLRGCPKAHEAATRAIEVAKKYGHFVICTATVQQDNFSELEAIKATLESMGAIPYFRAVVRRRSADENWADVGLDLDEYRVFYEFKYRHVIEAIRRGEASTLSKFYTYDMIPFMEHPRDDAELTALEWGVGCQACRSVSGIDVQGDFFPCDYTSQLTLGNLLRQPFSQIMESPLFKAIRDRNITEGRCSTCEHLKLCGGGCRVHAECETGNFLGSSPYCWHETGHVQRG